MKTDTHNDKLQGLHLEQFFYLVSGHDTGESHSKNLNRTKSNIKKKRTFYSSSYPEHWSVSFLFTRLIMELLMSYSLPLSLSEQWWWRSLRRKHLKLTSFRTAAVNRLSIQRAIFSPSNHFPLIRGKGKKNRGTISLSRSQCCDV